MQITVTIPANSVLATPIEPTQDDIDWLRTLVGQDVLNHDDPRIQPDRGDSLGETLLACAAEDDSQPAFDIDDVESITAVRLIAVGDQCAYPGDTLVSFVVGYTTLTNS